MVIPAHDEQAVNTTTNSQQRAAKIAALTDGGYLLVWQSLNQDGDGWGIYGQRYDQNGNRTGSEIRINPDTAGNQAEASVVGLPNGGYAVAWSDGNGEIYGRIYGADNTVQANLAPVNTQTANAQYSPDITSLSNGDIVIIWTGLDQEGVRPSTYAQRFNSQGERQGEEFQVNITTGWYQVQDNPAITALNDGGFVVVWHSYDTRSNQDGDVLGQLYTGQGVATGPAFQIDTTSSGSEFAPQVVSLASGFVVLWQFYSTSGSLSGIFGRLYGADGTPSGEAFRVSYGSGEQVTPLPGGGFLAVYTLWGQDGSCNGVFGQAFDAMGNRVGDEFQINQYAGTPDGYDSSAQLGQEAAAVTTLTDGSLVVAWESGRARPTPQYPDTSGDGIYLRHLATTTPVIERQTFTIEEGSSSVTLGTVIAAHPQGNPLTFSLTSGNEANWFNLDATTGRLSLTSQANLDFESQIDHTLLVQVSDGVNRDNAPITIRVVDVSEPSLYVPIPLSDEIQGNTYTEDDQQHPSLAALPGGGFVLIWQSQYQDGSGWGVYGQRFASDGQRVGDEFRVNVDNANDQHGAAVTALTDGGFVVVWTDADGTLHGRRYDASGTPTTRFDPITSSNTAQSNPAITGLDDGGFLVTWRAWYQDGDQGGIYGRRYAADGTALGDDFRVNTETWEHQDDPDVIGLSDGSMVVFWHSSAYYDHRRGLSWQRFDATGSPVGSESIIHPFPEGFSQLPQAAVLSNGTYVVVWREESYPNAMGSYGQIFQNDGTPLGGMFRLSSFNALDAQVTALPQGGVLATYGIAELEGGGIFGQTFDASGRPVGEEFQINRFTNIVDFYDNEDLRQQYPEVITLANGSLVVAWESVDLEDADDGTDGIRIRILSTASPVVDDQTFILAEDAPAHTLIGTLTARDPNGEALTFTITDGNQGGWFTLDEQNGQLFLAAGAALDYESLSLHVLTVQVSDGIHQDTARIQVRVADLPDDPPTIPIPAGNEFSVNTYTENQQRFPHIASLEGGGYLLVWQSLEQDGSGWGVYGQRFAANGARQGGEFRINPDNAGYQGSPVITALPGGGFVIAWGDNGDLRGRIYNASGEVGVELPLINTFTDGGQYQPQISALTDGGFIVSWISERYYNSRTIYAQRFDQVGAKVGTEFWIGGDSNNGSDIHHGLTELTDGQLVVVWQEYNGSYYEHYLQRLDEGGVPSGFPTVIDGSRSWDEGSPTILALPNGGFVVAWSADYGGAHSWMPERGMFGGAFAQVFQADGTPEGEKFRISDGSQVRLTTMAEGGFLAVYERWGADGSHDGIFARAFTLSGEVAGEEFAINQYTDTPESNYPWELDQEYPSVATLSNGSIVVAWESGHTPSSSQYPDDSEDGIYARLLSIATPVVEDQRFAISENAPAQTVIGTIAARDPNGTPLSYAIQSGNEGGWFRLDANSGQLSLTADAHLDFETLAQHTLVVQVSDGVLNDTARIILDVDNQQEFFWQEATAIGDEIAVNTSTDFSQNQVRITSLTGGGFVQVWQSCDQYGTPREIYGQLFAADGSKTGGEFRIDSQTTAYRDNPAVTPLTDGGFAVVWSEDGGVIKGRLYNAAGTLVRELERINTTEGGQYEPAIRTLPDGSFVVTWTSVNQYVWDIHGQRFNAQGTTVGGEFRINSDRNGYRELSDLSTLPDGGFMAVWQEGDGSSFGIYGQRYDDQGSAVGSSFLINTSTGGNRENATITPLSNGMLVVVWKSWFGNAPSWSEDRGRLSGLFARIYRQDGTPLGDEVRLTEDEGSDSRVIPLENEGFLVAWTIRGLDGSGDGIFARAFDASGQSTSATFQINQYTATPWNDFGLDQEFPDLARLTDGTIVFAWESGREQTTTDYPDGSADGIYTRLFRLNEASPPDPVSNPVLPWSGEIPVNTYTSDHQRNGEMAALTNGGFVMVWQSLNQDGAGWGIYGQRFDANGGRTGNEFVINPNNAGNQIDPAVAALTNGGFVVTWSDDDGNVYGRRYDAGGTLLTTYAPINTTTSDGQYGSSVAALNDGSFVVAWTSYNQDGSGEGVYGQRYDADGVPVGNEFRVNTTIAGDQNTPAILTLNDGSVVVAWFTGDAWQEGFRSGSYAQRFSPDGTPLGEEFRLGNGSSARLVALPTGGFFVASEVWGRDGSYDGIFGQAFDQNGSRLGEEVQINLYGGTPDGSAEELDQERPLLAALTNGFLVAAWESGRPGITTADLPDNSGDGLYFRLLSTAAPVVDDQRFIVAENSPAETLVGIIAASDPNRDSLTYALVSGNEAGWFALDAASGTLTLTANARLDFENLAIHTLGVRVSDGVRSDTATVTLQVANREDDPPARALPTGEEMAVNTTMDNHQRNAKVAALSGGGYVVVWQSLNQDGDSWGVYGQRFTANGSKVGTEFRINPTNAGEQSDPVVAGLANGGFTVAWYDGSGDVHGRQYDANGNVTVELTPVNTYTTNSQYEPAITALLDGGYVITWNSLNQDNSSNGVYGQRFTSQGTTAGSEFRLNSFTPDDQRSTALASLPDGGFVAVWQSRGEDYTEYGIFAQRYDQNSRPVGSEFLIHSLTGGSQYDPHIATLNNGSFVVVWFADTNSAPDWDPAKGTRSGSFGRIFLADGTPLGGEFRLGSGSVPQVVAQPGGGFLVVSEVWGQDGSYDGIFAQSYDDAGHPVGDALQINQYAGTPDDSTEELDQERPTVAALTNGSLVVVWESGRPVITPRQLPDISGDGIYARILSTTAPVMDRQIFTVAEEVFAGGIVGTVSATDPNNDSLSYSIVGGSSASLFQIEATSGLLSLAPDTVLDFETQPLHQLEVQVSDGTGSIRGEVTVHLTDVVDTPVLRPIATGDEFAVNTFAENHQRNGAIAALTGGGFVMVWHSLYQDGSDWGIYGQRFAGDGSKTGTEFRINPETTGNQTDPAVTGLADGGFVVAWNNEYNGEVHGRRYDAQGNLLADFAHVNTTTSEAQNGPSLVALPDGGFVVAWNSYGQDGSSWGVYGQRFDSLSVASGGEFRFNTNIGDQQYNPALTPLADGGFVAVWQSMWEDGYGFGIFGQRFDPSGLTQGSQFRVNTIRGGSQENPVITTLANGTFLVAWDFNPLPNDLSAGMTGGTFGRLFHADGTPLGDEFRLGTGRTIRVAPLPEGGFLAVSLLWGDDRSIDGIFGQAFDNSGHAMGELFQLNQYAGTPDPNQWDLDQEYPMVAALTNGTLVVGWESGRPAVTSPDLPDNWGDGLYARLISTSVPVVDEQVFELAENSGAGKVVGRIEAGDPNGDSLTWSIISGNEDHWFALNANTGILTLTEQAAIDFEQQAAHTLQVGVSDGSLRDEATITLRITDQPGEATTKIGAVSDEWGVNTTTDNHQRDAAIAPLSNGGFVVVWQSQSQDGSGWGIYGQRFDANGSRQDGEFLIPTTTINDQVEPAVAALAEGGFVVVWSDSDGNVHGRRFNSQGEAVGELPLINTYTQDNQSTPAIAPQADGGFVVTWHSYGQDGSGYGIYGQRFNQLGGMVGNEFRVNINIASDQSNPSLCVLREGGFVVVWQSYYEDGSLSGIFGQRFDTTGNQLEAPFRVNTVRGGEQFSPCILALENGGYVVAWTSDTYWADTYDPAHGQLGGVFGQVYRGDGSKVGGEFRIGSGRNAHLSSLAGGGFLAVTQVHGLDGSYGGIFAQAFDATGQANGERFQVNQFAASLENGDEIVDQERPAVATLTDGSLVVAWESGYQEATSTISDTSGFGIHARLFAPVSRPWINFRLDGSEDTPLSFTSEGFATAFNANTGTSLAQIRITALPEYGILRLNGETVSVGQEIPLAALDSLTFLPEANWHGSTTLTWQGNDGSGYSSPLGQTALWIANINNLPSVTNGTSTGWEDRTLSLSDADFVSCFSDLDGDGLNRIKIVALPDHGSLWLSGSRVAVEQEISLARLDELTFVPDAEWSGSNSLIWRASDGSDYSSQTATWTFNINPVNDTPTLSTGTKSGDEDGTITFTTADFSVHFSDGEGNSLESVRFASLPGHGLLKLAGVPVTVGQIIIAADLTNLTFTPNTDWSGSTNLTWQGSDGSTFSTATTLTLTVAGVNDAPVVTGFGKTGSEDQAIFFTLTDLLPNYSDAEGDQLTAIRIVSLPGQGVLRLANQVVTAGQEILATSLRDLVFTPVSNWNGTTSFSWQASDGTGWSSVAALNLSIAGVNDPPLVSNNSQSMGGTETLSFTVEDFSGHYSDVDNNPLVRIRILSLPESGFLRLAGQTVQVNQEIPVASLTDLTFTPAANQSGIFHFTWIGHDGIGYAETSATFTIDVNQTNLPPTVNTVQRSGEEDGTITFSVNDFTSSFADENGDSLLKIRIISLPANGVLRLSNQAVTVNQEILTNDLAQLTFIPNANWSGATFFDWQGSDGTYYSGESATVNLSLSAVNDTPVVSSSTKTGTEDNSISFTATDFTSVYSDREESVLASVRITALPSTGGLFIGQTPVTLNQEILVNQLASLTFIPANNWSGSTSFDWQGSDGQTYSNTTALTLTLASVADSMTVSDVMVNGNEDSVFFLLADAFTSHFSNPDGNPLAKIQILSLPANSTLMLYGNPVSVNQEIPISNLNGIYNFRFAPNANWHGTTGFQWRGSDGSSYSAPANVTLNIASINDIPTIYSFSKRGDENSTLTLSSSDFSIQFFDQKDNNTPLAGIRVVTLPEHGSLTLDGRSVTAGEYIVFADLSELAFIPERNWYGTTSWEWRGSDGLDESGTASVTFNLNNVPNEGEIFLPTVTYTVDRVPSWIGAGDINGDGHEDILVSREMDNSTLSILLGDGSGQVGPEVRRESSFFSTGAMGDFNRDGIDDFVGLSRRASLISHFLFGVSGSVSGLTHSVSVVPQNLVVGDINWDGNPDILFGEWSNRVGIHLGKGDGSFQTSILYPVGTPSSMALGDLNGDGWQDLVVANSNIAVLLNNGNGGLQSQVTYAVSPGKVVVADINEDGKQDIVVANGQISWLAGIGDGTFGSVASLSTLASPSDLLAVDLNGDEHLDLAVLHNGDNLSILLGNGSGSFQLDQTYGTGRSPRSLTSGDLNDDGRPDLMFTNLLDNTFSVLLGTGYEPPPPVLSIATLDADKTEGNDGNTRFTFTVQRSGNTAVVSTVSWQVTLPANPSTANDNDFASGGLDSGSLTFQTGETSKTITISVVGDSLWEGDETFQVQLGSPTAARLGTATVTATIRNDDQQIINHAPTLSDGNKSVGGTSTLNFTASDFSQLFSDADGDSLTRIKIISLPDNGSLRLSGNQITVNQEIVLADLADLTFTPAVNQNSTADFTWQGRDGSDYSSPATLTLVVTEDVTPTTTYTTPVSLGQEFKINSQLADYQGGVSLGALQGGGFVAAWRSRGQDGSGFGVYGQRFTATGEKVGSEFRVNSYTAYTQQGGFSRFVTPLSDGGFVVVWESEVQDGSETGVYGQRYTSSGDRAGEEFRINTYTSDDQDRATVVALSGGGFVSLWHSLGQDGSGFGIYGQRFTTSGEREGGEFRVNTYTANNQEKPAVTALQNGGFVALWQSYGQDGSGYGIYGQRFAATGEKVGDEFLVNTTTAAYQEHPSITTLNNGHFVAMWESQGQDGSGYGAYGQLFNATGGRIGEEFQINTYSTNSQNGVDIVALADGGFVATWQSENQDGSGWGIFGRRFNAFGTSVGDEFLITGRTDNNQWDPSVVSLENGTFVVAWQTYYPTTTGDDLEARIFTIGLFPDEPTPSTNHAPSVDSFSRSGSEEGTITFSLTDFVDAFSDADRDTLAAIRIDTLPANGTLRLSNGEVTQGQEIVAANLANLTFTPAADWNGTTSFQWLGSDGSVYAASPATVTLNLAPLNDIPTLVNGNKSVGGTSALTFTASDFSQLFSDADGDSLTRIKIISLPDNGSLRLSGNQITVNQEIVLADLASLTFTPAVNQNSTADFTWQGSDGSAYSSSATMTLNVNAIAITPPLDADDWSWQGASLTETANGLRVNVGGYRGYASLTSDTAYDLRQGGEVRVAWRVSGGGTYTEGGVWFSDAVGGYGGYYAGAFSEGLTTAWSYAGSLVIPENTWLYLVYNVHENQTIDLSLATGAYADQGGSSLFTRTGVNIADSDWVRYDEAHINISTGDAYGGTSAWIEVRELTVDAPVSQAPVNHAPVVNHTLVHQQLAQLQPYQWTLPSDAFTDVDSGDTLQWSVTLANGQPLPYWLSFQPLTRILQGTPILEEELTLRVTARDSQGATVSQNVTLTISPFQIPDIHPFVLPWGMCVFDGRGQSVQMTGGEGDDIFVIDDEGDRITQSGGGRDMLLSMISTTLDSNLAMLRLGGNNPVNGTGNALANTMLGNLAANILNGGDGDDQLDGLGGGDGLFGGLGNDHFTIHSLDDLVAENAGEGIDTIACRLSLTLPDNVENLTLSTPNFPTLGRFKNVGRLNQLLDANNPAKSATGNELDNTLTGNAFSNTLDGQDGNDTLIGSMGADTLTGGAGADVFRYFAPHEGGDQITDFSPEQGDKFSFFAPDFGQLPDGTLSSDRFMANSTGIATAADQRFIYNTSTNTLSYDQDGNGLASSITLALLNSVPLRAGDITLFTAG